MKFHILSALIVIILSLIFEVTKNELLIIILTISFVLSCELINTAIEKSLDLVLDNKKHPLAKFAKDAAAGAVLISALASIFIAYIIFFDKIMKFIITKKNIHLLFGRMSHITVLIFSLLCIVIVSLKAYFGKGTALEGGMPSGHACIAASITTLTFKFTDDYRLILLIFLLYLLVCQSRIKSGIHTFSEVLVGSLIGYIVTYGIICIL